MGWRPSGRYTPPAKRGKMGSYETGKLKMALCDHEGTRGLAPLSILGQAPALFHHSIIPVGNMQDGCWGFLIIDNS